MLTTVTEGGGKMGEEKWSESVCVRSFWSLADSLSLPLILLFPFFLFMSSLFERGTREEREETPSLIWCLETILKHVTRGWETILHTPTQTLKTNFSDRKSSKVFTLSISSFPDWIPFTTIGKEQWEKRGEPEIEEGEWNRYGKLRERLERN